MEEKEEIVLGIWSRKTLRCSWTLFALAFDPVARAAVSRQSGQRDGY
jgi:hypothetical protein